MKPYDTVQVALLKCQMHHQPQRDFWKREALWMTLVVITLILGMAGSW